MTRQRFGLASELEIAKLVRKGELQKGAPRPATAFELTCRAYGLDSRITTPWQLAYKIFGIDPKAMGLKEFLRKTGYASVGELIANAI